MISDPESIEGATRRLCGLAQTLERITPPPRMAATNVCERTAFMLTGNPRELRSHGY